MATTMMMKMKLMKKQTAVPSRRDVSLLALTGAPAACQSSRFAATIRRHTQRKRNIKRR